MKAPLMLVALFAALAVPALAEDVQSATGDSGAHSQLDQPGKHLEKMRKLMKRQSEMPSWNWDDYDCGSFPEDQISLLSHEYRVA